MGGINVLACKGYHNCAAYEFYDATCNLFETSETLTDKSTGFLHCERLGIAKT